MADETVDGGEVIVAEESREKLDDLTYLPSVSDVQQAFPYADEGQRMIGNVPEFKRYMAEKGIFQLSTQEFVTDLAHQVAELSEGEEINVLEVGAGGGALGHHLRKELERQHPGRQVSVRLTDDKSYGKGEDYKNIKPAFDAEVEEVDSRVAVGQVDRPTIVVSSWMPDQEDWTPDFRANPNVVAYVLIGDPSVTGGREEMWNGTPEGFRVEDWSNPYGVHLKGNLSMADNTPHYVSQRGAISNASVRVFVRESK